MSSKPIDLDLRTTILSDGVESQLVLRVQFWTRLSIFICEVCPQLKPYARSIGLFFCLKADGKTENYLLTYIVDSARLAARLNQGEKPFAAVK